MPFISELSSDVCHLAVGLALGCAVFSVAQAFVREHRLILVGLRLAVLPFAAGLLVRLATPWGPLTASGRDLGYLDAAILGPSAPHTHLIAATYNLVRLLPDPVAGFELGQIILGALGCSLIATVTYQLCRREVPAVAAGLLAAGLVALARSDAGPAAEVSLRFFLLLSVSLSLLAFRTGSRVALVGAAGAAVALAYGRLEALLLVMLLFVWVAAFFPRGWSASGAHGEAPRLRVLTALVCATAVLTLVSRLFLLLGLAAILTELWRQRGRHLPSRLSCALALGLAVATLPRAIEVFSMERGTYQRFPWVLVKLLGQSHLLPFDPGLCSTVVPLLMGVALYRLWRFPELRRAEGAIVTYLCCVGLPSYCFYTVFMGGTPTMIKLQGIGILLLLPLAGLGAEAVYLWLLGRWGRQTLVAAALVFVLGGATLVLGWGTLRQETTLQAEYRFLVSMGSHVSAGAKIHHLPGDQRATHLGIPRVLGERGLFVPSPTTVAGAVSAVAPGDLVFLGAGCWRFLDSEILPGQGQSLQKYQAGKIRERPLYWIAFSIFNNNRVIRKLVDELRVRERTECSELKRILGLVPVHTTVATRGDLEGRVMPKRITFGLYRASAGSGRGGPGVGSNAAPSPSSRESARRAAASGTGAR